MVASYSNRGGDTRMKYTIEKAWIPRKCFICGEKEGWGKNNVDAIRIYGKGCYQFWAHFHPHCLKDAICCPENYKNNVVDLAVSVHEKWEELLLSDRVDRASKQYKLKEVQKSICKGEHHE